MSEAPAAGRQADNTAADPASTPAESINPLLAAVSAGDVQLVEQLLSATLQNHGASVLATDNLGHTALDVVTAPGLAALLLAGVPSTEQGTKAVENAVKENKRTQRWDVLAVLLKEYGRRAPHALLGLLDELDPSQYQQIAPAVVQAWLQDTSSLEQQQEQLKQEQADLQDSKVALQQLFLAAAAAVRNQAVPPASEEG